MIQRLLLRCLHSLLQRGAQLLEAALQPLQGAVDGCGQRLGVVTRLGRKLGRLLLLWGRDGKWEAARVDRSASPVQ